MAAIAHRAIRGDMTRATFDALRDAPGPMTTIELARPWHAAHTAAARSFPASILAACATCVTARKMANPSTFFMDPLPGEIVG